MQQLLLQVPLRADGTRIALSFGQREENWEDDSLLCPFLPNFLQVLEYPQPKCWERLFSNITSLHDPKHKNSGRVLLTGNCHLCFWRTLSCLVVVLGFCLFQLKCQNIKVSKYPLHVYGEDRSTKGWFLLIFRKHPHSLLLAAPNASCCFNLCFLTEVCVYGILIKSPY